MSISMHKKNKLAVSLDGFSYDKVMKKDLNPPTTIDEYIAQCPEKTKQILQKVRETIKAVAPTATEKIGYGIPTFVLNGKNLVHFAGYENHIGLYPGPSAIEALINKSHEYKTSKGTLQFPIDKPIPYELIREITAFCAERNSTAKKAK